MHSNYKKRVLNRKLTPSFFSYIYPLLLKLYYKNYFEAARSPMVRSILNVCEQPAGKADAKRALLDNFIMLRHFGQAGYLATHKP